MYSRWVNMNSYSYSYWLGLFFLILFHHSDHIEHIEKIGPSFIFIFKTFRKNRLHIHHSDRIEPYITGLLHIIYS